MGTHDIQALERKLEQAKAQLHAPDFPEVQEQKNGGTRILATIENLDALMKHCALRAEYDVIHKRVKVSGLQSLVGEEENTLLSELLSQAGRYGLPTGNIKEFLRRLSHDCAINPVVSWLESLPPCNDDPVPEFIEHCGFAHKEWSETACRRWFIQSVAAADHRERSDNKGARPEFPYVLVLAGEQGLKKTALMYELLPGHMRDYFSAGRMLQVTNRDSVVEAVSNWIVELGEIDSTFRKSDIAALKAFLTNRVDDLRLPYAAAWSKIQRRTSFMATVNHTKFLQDTTGNRRFWPLVVERKIPSVPEDMAARLWAYSWARYLDGEQWWLTPTEEAQHAKIVAAHEDKPLKEKLLDLYNFDIDTRPLELTTVDILKEMGLPNDRSAQTQLGQILTKDLDIEKRQRKYQMPPRTSSNTYNL